MKNPNLTKECDCMTMYEKYCHLDIDGRWIGLEKSDMNIGYFCTPVDARIIG